MKPCGEFVVLSPVTERSAGGIVIPDVAENKVYQQAEVLAVGPGRVLESGGRSEVDCKPGDLILYQPAHALQVELHGRKVRIIHATHIMLVVGTTASAVGIAPADGAAP